jgi:hypothetical protein
MLNNHLETTRAELKPLSFLFPVSRVSQIHHRSYLSRPGGVLTVADDLLKNDSTRFLEMMEQLAERRMMREEAAIQMMEDGRDGGNQRNQDVEEDEDEDEDDLDDEDDEDE